MKAVVLCQASRTRVVRSAPAGEADGDLLRLLDEQVFSRYLAFPRGYLRGGKVDDFFVACCLPRSDQKPRSVARSSETRPTAVDILESRLLTPAYLWRAALSPRQQSPGRTACKKSCASWTWMSACCFP